MSRASQMAKSCFARKTPPLSVMSFFGAPNRSMAAYKTIKTQERSWLFANQVARGFVHARLARIRMRFVWESLDSFLDPSFENLVNRGAGNIQIVCNRRNTPALSVEAYHGLAALFWRAHLFVAGKL